MERLESDLCDFDEPRVDSHYVRNMATNLAIGGVMGIPIGLISGFASEDCGFSSDVSLAIGFTVGYVASILCSLGSCYLDSRYYERSSVE